MEKRGESKDEERFFALPRPPPPQTLPPPVGGKTFLRLRFGGEKERKK